MFEAVDKLDGSLFFRPRGVGEEPQRHEEAIFLFSSEWIPAVGVIDVWYVGKVKEELLSKGLPVSFGMPSRLSQCTERRWG